jgi:hypothetical protein
MYSHNTNIFPLLSIKIISMGTTGGALFDVGFFEGSTDSSVAGLGFLCRWVTLIAERLW